MYESGCIAMCVTVTCILGSRDQYCDYSDIASTQTDANYNCSGYLSDEL